MDATKKYRFVFLAAVLLLLHAGAALAQTVWTKYAGNPVLAVGPAGAWDSTHIARNSDGCSFF